MSADNASMRGTGTLTRREAIKCGVVAAGGALISSLAPGSAQAAAGETVQVDHSYDGGKGTTVTYGNLGATGELVAGTLAFGLIGMGFGVRGTATAAAGAGSAGVRGDTYAAGAPAVEAVTHANGATALKASADSPTLSGTAVDASVGLRGTAVRATAPIGAKALDVHGVVAFSRSGIGKVIKNHQFANVTVAGDLSANALILVTLRNAGSGVYLWYAKRVSPTQFQVRLNRPATTMTYFSWLVVG